MIRPCSSISDAFTDPKASAYTSPCMNVNYTKFNHLAVMHTVTGSRILFKRSNGHLFRSERKSSGGSWAADWDRAGTAHENIVCLISRYHGVSCYTVSVLRRRKELPYLVMEKMVVSPLSLHCSNSRTCVNIIHYHSTCI